MTRPIALVAAAFLPAASAFAVDGLTMFVSGLPKWTPPPPGTVLNVQVFARFPVNGTNIPWTTMSGSGQVGQMAGFTSAIFDIQGNVGTWSNLTLGPGFVGIPFGSPGTPSGSNVNNINAGVGFGSPLTGPTVFLWSAKLTLPSVLPPELVLSTTYRPIGSPPFGPYQGIEVALSGIIPNLNVTHYMTNVTSAHVVIPLPSPGTAAVLGLGTAFATRRRRA